MSRQKRQLETNLHPVGSLCVRNARDSTALFLPSMIQRIQTLYLLLATVFTALTAIFSFGWFKVADGQFYTLTLFGLQSSGTAPFTTEQYPFYAFIGTGLLAIIYLLWSICSFRHLKQQMTRIVIALLFLLLYTVGMGVEAYYLSQSISHTFTPNVGCLFLPAAIVLCIMAWRAVRRDHRLLRSVDRIR